MKEGKTCAHRVLFFYLCLSAIGDHHAHRGAKKSIQLLIIIFVQNMYGYDLLLQELLGY